MAEICVVDLAGGACGGPGRALLRGMTSPKGARNVGGLGLVLFVVLSALAAGWAGRPVEESYSVYGAAIAGLPDIFGADASPVYLFRETDPMVLPENRSGPQVRACLEELKASPETLEDFERQNSRVRQLEDRFATSRVQLVEAGQGPQGGWGVWVSAVGFNTDHTQAILTIDYQWGSQDYLLEKEGKGEWKVVRRSSGRGFGVVPEGGPRESR